MKMSAKEFLGIMVDVNDCTFVGCRDCPLRFGETESKYLCIKLDGTEIQRTKTKKELIQEIIRSEAAEKLSLI